MSIQNKPKHNKTKQNKSNQRSRRKCVYVYLIQIVHDRLLLIWKPCMRRIVVICFGNNGATITVHHNLGYVLLIDDADLSCKNNPRSATVKFVDASGQDTAGGAFQVGFVSGQHFRYKHDVTDEGSPVWDQVAMDKGAHF